MEDQYKAMLERAVGDLEQVAAAMLADPNMEHARAIYAKILIVQLAAERLEHCMSENKVRLYKCG